MEILDTSPITYDFILPRRSVLYSWLYIPIGERKGLPTKEELALPPHPKLSLKPSYP